jgi:predicted nucleotidyltransferase
MMKPNLTEAESACLHDLKNVADQLGLPILIVGAMARQLIFDGPNGIRPYRFTEDWDFGVKVDSWGSFSKLKAALLDTKRFEPTPREHRLTHTTGIDVDLVPFGGLEAHGLIVWPESGSEMNVTGFSEAYTKGIEIELLKGLSIRAATTPLQVALKFIAFADRWNRTDRDITDLWHFMRHYARVEDLVRLYEEPMASHLTVDENFDYNSNLGPLLLGFDVASACGPEIVAQLMKAAETLADPYSKYVKPLIAGYRSQDEEDAERHRVSASFEWLHRGIELAVKLRSVQP